MYTFDRESDPRQFAGCENGQSEISEGDPIRQGLLTLRLLIMNSQGARVEALCREHAQLARQNLDHVVSIKPSLVERVPGMALAAM